MLLISNTACGHATSVYSAECRLKHRCLLHWADFICGWFDIYFLSWNTKILGYTVQSVYWCIHEVIWVVIVRMQAPAFKSPEAAWSTSGNSGAWVFIVKRYSSLVNVAAGAWFGRFCPGVYTCLRFLIPGGTLPPHLWFCPRRQSPWFYFWLFSSLVLVVHLSFTTQEI